jgi:small subunit ribosomal protein S3
MILVEMKKPYAEAIILAEYIALQLESRGAFRKIMKKAIELADEKGNVHGIKIQIAGRLNGAEIARVEWAREGRVPLQTLRAKIDYCHYRAQTIYGVLGIKVWIFQ